MNRTKGFLNLNRFKSGRAIKKLNKSVCPKSENKSKKAKVKHG